MLVPEYFFFSGLLVIVQRFKYNLHKFVMTGRIIFWYEDTIMPANNKDFFLEQLDQVLDLYQTIDRSSKYSDFSDVHFSDYGRFRASAIAVINRVAGPGSTYAKEVDVLPMHRDHGFNNSNIPVIAGVVQALRDDVARNFLESARELIHGELFGDFLEMADFLANEGYKDAAAIMGGGVLETHIHQLCIKHSIVLEDTVRGQVQTKRADRLNDELSSVNAYSKLDQKNVKAWLDLRNKAAHAEYNQYTIEQVSLLLQSIRNFISRYPA